MCSVLQQRLHAAEREFRAVLGERSRIAREIHDTLAQGYVGISVQLEVLAELLRQRKVEAAAKQLDTTRELCARGTGRCAAVDLGAAHAGCGETTLPVQCGAWRRPRRAAGWRPGSASSAPIGRCRRKPSSEFLRVAQEAIHNVKKHAGASELFVQLEYGPETIALEVRDDGRGGALDRSEPKLRRDTLD